MCQVDVSIVHRHFAKSVFDRFNFVIEYKRRNMLVSYSCCAFNSEFEPSGEGRGTIPFCGITRMQQIIFENVVVVLFFNAFNFLIVY